MAKDIAFDAAYLPAGRVAAGTKHASLFARIFRALERSRQRAAEKEIERWLAMSGGRLTDDLEREIGRRLGQ